MVSPDEGSIKRALAHMPPPGRPAGYYRQTPQHRRKDEAGDVIGGEVKGKTALIFDDMISTAGSICGAAQVMHEAGAKRIFLAATHSLLVGRAVEHLQNAPIEGLVVTDTIPIPAGEDERSDQGLERRAAAGRGDQADPLERVGERAV